MAEVVVRIEGTVDVEMDADQMKRLEEEEQRGSSEVVRWERFLPGTALRVLLVEADDSTRHIISALLRKCNYTVSAVPDGLMAWEKLRCGPHDIDLILTEVELPSISGFSLLTLVMEHDICKNIPVIMMSSNDSISMVLKCMLKGAADFLIKPVRRNELRNLWRHVWKRHASKIEASSENNAASSHSSDYADSNYKNKECCEKENFSQGFSERKVKSPSNLCNASISKEKRGECAQLDEESVAPIPKTEERQYKFGLEIGYQDEAHNVTASQLDEAHASLKAVIQTIDVGLEGQRGNLNIHSEVNWRNDDVVETSRGVIDLIGTFDDRLKSSYEQFNNDDVIKGIETGPHLELSLRRFCPTSSKEVPFERHILNHSVASAFSRYNHGKAWQPLFPASTTNCNGLREGSKLSHELLSSELPDNTRCDSQQLGAISTSSQENITGTQVLDGQAEQEFPISVPVARYDMCAGNNHVLTHKYHKQSGLSSVWPPKVSCQQEKSRFPTAISVSVHNPEQVCHRSDETTNNSSDQVMHGHNKMDTMEGPGFGSCAAGQSATSSLCNAVTDHDNDGAYGSSFNRSEGKSNLPVIDDRGRGPESLDGRFLGMDSLCLSQREAALTKFRLKRKERCYEKKVRYQSRKRLAEQRPRVKGQFVRQVQNDTAIADANGCP